MKRKYGAALARETLAEQMMRERAAEMKDNRFNFGSPPRRARRRAASAAAGPSSPPTGSNRATSSLFQPEEVAVEPADQGFELLAGELAEVRATSFLSAASDLIRGSGPMSPPAKALGAMLSRAVRLGAFGAMSFSLTLRCCRRLTREQYLTARKT